MLKCLQLLPLLPMEAWIQKLCLDSGAVHSLALAYHRCVGSVGGGVNESPLLKALRTALRCVFAQNMEICVQAVDDTFVSDEFVCLEVLDELREMEKKRHGSFRCLDSEWGIIGKVMGLWAFHQRKALEDANPQGSASREVLKKATGLLTALLLKLPPVTILLRMQEFQNSEPFQRIAIAAVHETPQIRLQVAVNYVDNGAIPVIVGGLQAFIRRYEGGPGVSPDPSFGALERAFSLLQDEKLPADGWPYVQHCLDICLHILSHWSATRLSLSQKADVLDVRAAPLLLAQGGLVDALAELLDPRAAGFELIDKPPQRIQAKASETLQALFEQNGHICLFCMQHYTEVKQMVSLGCDSLANDPLNDFPEMQQQAAEQLALAFEKFSADDERLGRKVLKALAVLFESSYRLVVWFLQKNNLALLGEYQSLDVHVEAMRAIARAPYWSHEDAAILPDFVVLAARLLLGSVEGLTDEPATMAPGEKPKRRVLDLTEAEELVAASTSALLHVLLIDPSPPMVLRCLVQGIGESAEAAEARDAGLPPLEDVNGGSSEEAVGAVMKVMRVFPSSDRVQMNCQHLLTSFLGD